jgi:GH15 family glucan-1,4-alpha-glucosidase
MFVKMLNVKEGEKKYDLTIDISSVYGVFAFGVLPADDPKLARAWETTVRTLSRGISVGGLARYEGDNYNRTENDSAGNPWIITTLWYAEYLTAIARTENDFDRVRSIFSWVVQHAEKSGTLAEQLHPSTGFSLNATPLTWSHAGYVMALLKYLDRLEELGICVACSVAL